MKKILHILSLALLTSWASAQSISVVDENQNPITDGSTTAVSLSTNELIDGLYLEPKFLVKNETNEDLILYIRRTIVQAPEQWTDALCWPPSCFDLTGSEASTPTSNMVRCTVKANSTTAYILAYDPDEEDPIDTYLKPRITINGVIGEAQYRFEVVEFGSSDVLFTFDMNFTVTMNTLSVKKDSAISLAPNPATDVVTVTVPDNGNGSIQMVDILGNVVYNADFTGTKKINTTQFKNGVYFVVITANGTRSNKKLVVRH